MKFGAHLKSVQLHIWRYYYIDYDLLKKKIKDMSVQGKDCPIEVEAEFVEFLNRELDKVASFQFVKSGELHRRAEHCETIIRNLYSKHLDAVHLERVEEEMHRITLETNHLSKFTRLNYTGFLKIVKKHDKHTSFELKPMFIAKLNARPFFRETFDALILKLSLLYDTVRNHGQPSAKREGEENVAQSFVRQTTKFWVHPDNVTEVKLKILKYLPVLIFGSKREYDPAISSVYFDNDQFELYKGRLEKTHGAEAIRFRWYGASGQQEIFAERKTHREDWTGEKSVKERFPIKEKRVDAYLAGTWSWDAQLQKMRKKKEKPDAVLDAMRVLADEMQHTLRARQLRPVLRTFYNRTAFQLPGDARVRVSLDTELTMVRETGVGESGLPHWRREDVGTQWPFSELDPADVHRFPYAVLEVKLQTQLGLEPPLWVRELVASHLVEAVPKFSKFVHGCATLYESQVALLPFWLPQMDQDIRKPPPPGPPLAAAAGAEDDLFALDVHAPAAHRPARGRSALRGAGAVSTARLFADDDDGDGDGDGDDDDDDETARLLAPPVHDRRSASSSTSSATISTPAYPGILGQIVSLMKALRVAEQGASSPAGRRLPATLGNKRIVVPVRVEPKVFFANERTFLAWLHFAALIAGLALSLLNFGDRHARTVGCVLCLVAIGIMFYALYLFLWRSDKIRKHEPGPYDDRGGPVVIVIVLMISILVNFWLKYQHAE